MTSRSIEIILIRRAWNAETAICQPATTAAAIMNPSESHPTGVSQDRIINSPETAVTPQVFQVFMMGILYV